jgi:hypothetical protein
MYEHSEPSDGFPVVDLDLEDEDADQYSLDTSGDEEITRKLFGDLNRDLLGPPNDGKVIVISDSDEEEHEYNHANTNAMPSSLRIYLPGSIRL